MPKSKTYQEGPNHQAKESAIDNEVKLEEQPLSTDVNREERDEFLEELKKEQKAADILWQSIEDFIQTVNAETSVNENVPDVAVDESLSQGDIEKRIDELRTKIEEGTKEMEGMRRDLINFRHGSVNHKIDGINDFFIVKTSIDSIKNKVGHAARLSRELMSDQEALARLKEKHLSNTLKEYNKGSTEELRDLYSRAIRERYKAEGLFNLGSIFNRSGIKQKKEQEDRLRTALGYIKEDYFFTSNLVTKNEVIDIMRSCAVGPHRSIQDRVRTLEDRLKESKKEKDQPLLSHKETALINRTYIENIIKPKLEKSVRVLVEQNKDPEVFHIETPPDSSEVERILTLLTEIYCNPDPGQITTEKIEANKKNQAELDGLRTRLNMSTGHIIYDAKIELGAPCDRMAKFIDEADILERQTALSLASRSADDKLREIDSKYPELFAGDYSFYVPNIDHGMRRLSFIFGGPHVSIEVSDLNVHKFEAMEQTPEIRERFGSKLKKARVFYGEACKKDVLNNVKNREIRVEAGVKLFRLAGKENAAFMLMNAYRESNSSDSANFLTPGTSDGISIVNILKGFSDEDLRYVEDQGIPGLIDAINIIRRNPDDFDKSGNNINAASEEQPSEAYKQIQSKLSEMAQHYLSKKDPRMAQFLIDFCGQIGADLGDGYELMKENLELDKNRETLEIYIYSLRKRFDLFKDEKALGLFAELPRIIEQSKDTMKDDEYNQLLLRYVNDLYALVNWGGADQDEILKDRNSPVSVLFRRCTESCLGVENDPVKLVAMKAAGRLGLSLVGQEEYLLGEYLKREAGQAYDLQETINILVEKGLVNFNKEQSRRLAEGVYQSIVHCVLGGLSVSAVDTKLMDTLLAHDMIDPAMRERCSTIKGILDMKNKPELIGEENLNGDDWLKILFWYISSEGGTYLNEEFAKKITNVLSNEHPKNRDFCLEQLRTSWSKFLETGELDLGGSIISRAVHLYQGAGDLKYVEQLSNMIFYADTCLNGKTAPKTKEALLKGFKGQEEKFDKENWSNEDRAAYYSIAKDLLAASPSLYTDFLGLFEVISAKDMKTFSKDYFPLYQAMITIFQKQKKGGNAYSGRDLVKIRKKTEILQERITAGEPAAEVFKSEKDGVLDLLKETFKDRFGLEKIPENFDQEHIRSLQNFIRYMGNMSNKNQDRENLVALYLSLTLNGEWHNFRRGEPVKTEEMFSGVKRSQIEDILKRNKDFNAVHPEILGIDESQVAAFRELFEEETISSMIGNVQTIDVRLGNAKRGIDDLADPDAYEDKADKAAFQMYRSHGKRIGEVLAEAFAFSSGKKKEISEKNVAIAAELQKVFGVEKWTPETVKGLQDQTRVVSLIDGLLRKINDENVDEAILDLSNKLSPPEAVTAAFNRIGEPFERGSGAMALSQDLVYLENILAKNEQKLEPSERESITAYLEDIRSSMRRLEEIMERTKEYFQKVKKTVHGSNKEVIKNRIAEIEKILYSTETSSHVVSRMTSDMNLVIENMRQCLGCLGPEINNDTNLTFGDQYKFYMMSQADKNTGSIADELVLFIPSTREDGQNEMTFALDQVYGSKSADVLVSHTLAAYKKYKQLKASFPGAKMSVSIPESTMRSVGLSAELLQEKLADREKNLKMGSHEINVNIPRSNLGDNYIEFGYGGGGSRGTGIRSTKALVIE